MTPEQFLSLTNQNNEIISRVSVLESRLEPLFDNGQPGILTQLDKRIDDLETIRDKQHGVKAAALAGLAIIMEAAHWMFSGRSH